MKLLNNTPLIIVVCLTLGLAPFYPEPHLWGKLQWIAGDGNGMKPADWFDVFLHGFPFILLIRIIIVHILKLVKK
ncbi:hypothetical protein G5B37_01250 [Rasiella rasia]|uniref:RND transporter n=1 Tax=Rasiella rasia TaxID=2744027 RepID=A0A6G6GIA7_9FLAO|nr:hypothetical protein [Rasiella rasia]QIE58240.1 hypothetical protein G5B37_01250 [Rasiella rasia]